MPRIDAPTVAEHHLRRRAALLEAAARLLAERGVDGVTLAAVGAAAGLARSSVYQYFDSSSALIAAVVEDVVPREVARLTAAVAAAATPRDRIDTFVRSTLRAATDTTHRSIGALGLASLPPGCRARIAELHDEQRAPLREALVGLGVRDVDLTVHLVMGLIQAATRAVLDGAALEPVAERAIALLHDGLGPTGST